jgi:hypothetical protein
MISPLLKANEITRLGLTKTQVFYLVGKQLQKGLCRFVKTDRLKDAICTLLSIKGFRYKIEDVRLGDTPGSLKVFTGAGTHYIPSSEASAFFTRYNQLAVDGCSSECKCDDAWRHICVHRIAEHLANVKEKVEAIVRSVKDIASAKREQEQQEAQKFRLPLSLMSKSERWRRDTDTSRYQTEERQAQATSIQEWRSYFPEQLDRLNELQHVALRQGLKAVNPNPEPFHVDIVVRRTNESLGQVFFNKGSWAVRLVDDREVSVGSVLEGLLILKDPAQLEVDF